MAQYFDESDVKKAALMIKVYCSQTNCSECVFGYHGGLDCDLNEPDARTPKDWGNRTLMEE